MTGMLRVPRTRGALSGLALILLGAWGAVIPFVGPAFRFAYTPDVSWTYTSGRFWLEILPGAAVLLAGLIVLGSSSRPLGLLGGWLAALGGAWFAVGPVLGPAWPGLHLLAGRPVGGPATRALEQISFFTGLGVVIVFFAALAIGRLTVVGVAEVRLAKRAAERRAAAEAEQRMAADRAAADRAAAEQAAADRANADRITADRAAADRAADDRVTADRVTAGQTAADRATAEQRGADQVTAQHGRPAGTPSSDPVAPEKATTS